MGLLVRAGTIVCDHRGVPVAQVTQDIHSGESLRPDHFVFADGHTPVFGELLPSAVSTFLERVGAC